MLLFYYMGYLYLMGITYWFVYGNVSTIIHTLRTGHIISLLLPSMTYFYLLQSLHPRPYSWKDMIHLIPSIFYVIDFLPFFLQSSSYKLEAYATMSAEEYRIGFSQGIFMPAYGHIIIRWILILLSWLGQLHLLLKARRLRLHPIRVESPITWKWLHLFLFSQTIMFLLPLIGVFFNSSQLEAIFFSIGASLVVGFQSFYLLLYPEILQIEGYPLANIQPGMDNDVAAAPNASEVSAAAVILKEENVSPTPEQKWTSDDLHCIEQRVADFFKQQQPFTTPRYTLMQLANDTGFSPAKLSAFINYRYQMNYNDFINRWRIELVLQKMKDGLHNSKTLEAIAVECGFQSRVTFIRAFKKEKGMTPSEYLKQ